jgi:4'-phosphopantetheinyl transferase
METVYWLEQSAADVPASDDWMCAQELTRLCQLRIPKRRNEWRLGRWTAKLAFAHISNWPVDFAHLARIEIRAAQSGFPELFIEQKPAPLTISITHRNGLAACAVAGSSVTVGCDLEWIEARSDAFIADYFTELEQTLIRQTGEDDRNLVATLLWSTKESTLKALHEGLRLDTRSVEVELREGSDSPLSDHQIWHPLLVRNANGAEYSGWWQSSANFVRTIVTAPDCAAPVYVTPFISLRKAEAPQEASCERVARADNLQESDCTLHPAR